MCFEVLKAPLKAIETAKRKRNMNTTISTLVIASVLIALAMTIALARGGFTEFQLAGTFISVFMLVLVGTMFMAVILGIIANTLGGKGKYFESLTPLAYTILAPSIGMFITSLFMFTDAIIAIPVGFVVMIITFAHGLSVFYKSVKELFKIDMVTTLVIISILMLVFFLTIWSMSLFGLGGMRTMFLRV